MPRIRPGWARMNGRPVTIGVNQKDWHVTITADARIYPGPDMVRIELYRDETLTWIS